MKPICLYGGTFDPPHIGHLILAEFIGELKALDSVFFVPAAIPPHKLNHQITPAHHRLNMLKLALSNNSRFRISEFELHRKGPTYSVETVVHFARNMNLTPSHIYFLIGADSLRQLHTWREPEKLLKSCSVLVVPRRGFEPECTGQSYLRDVEFIRDAPLIDISATMIRERVNRGLSIRYLVTDEVKEYIDRNGLYTSVNG